MSLLKWSSPPIWRKFDFFLRLRFSYHRGNSTKTFDSMRLWWTRNLALTWSCSFIIFLNKVSKWISSTGYIVCLGRCWCDGNSMVSGLNMLFEIIFMHKLHLVECLSFKTGSKKCNPFSKFLDKFIYASPFVSITLTYAVGTLMTCIHGIINVNDTQF